MRIAEVDNSGYLRARRVGELAYKNNVKADYINTTVTSEVFSLEPGKGKTQTIDLDTPEGYKFNGIYYVSCNHSIACSIGSFYRNVSTSQCWVAITNRTPSTTLNDCTVSIGVSFVKISAE